MLGSSETDVAPRSTAVLRLINSIAIRHATLAVVLASANPNSEWVLRIERDRADRIRAFVIEDRRPRDA